MLVVLGDEILFTKRGGTRGQYWFHPFSWFVLSYEKRPDYYVKGFMFEVSIFSDFTVFLVVWNQQVMIDIGEDRTTHWFLKEKVIN